jgi:uncharacterized membrane protein
MGILDGQFDKASLLDRISFKSLLIGCAISFVASVIGVPFFSFGAFTATGRAGEWMFGLIMLLFMIGAISGLLLVVLGIVALMQRKS